MAKLNLSMIDEYYEMMNDTRKECEGFIYDFLKEHGNCVETYNADTHDYVGEECVSVTYDGGNHPEYNSNAFSNLESLFIDENDDKIYLSIEDCTKYDIDRCSNDEIIYIAQYLNANAKEFDEMKK